jgi:spore coat polysaccharide biosynthesis protein SpsF
VTRCVVVVQARMSSRRLPGKVLRELSPGKTVLEWVVDRARAATLVAQVVVATSDGADDDVVEAEARRIGVPVKRGSLHDVLSRVRTAAETAGATTVVRVTADCPLVDPAVIDRIVREHVDTRADFTANRLPPPHQRTWPIGLDVEVATIEALRRADAEATDPAHREHVMPYLYVEPGRFSVRVVECDLGDFGAVRWTVDTPEDLAAVRALVAQPGVDVTTSWETLLEVWGAHPEIADLNADVAQKSASDVDERR